jgi:hypothetical protein
MIKLFIERIETSISNKKGLKILQNHNPKEKFKIAKCKSTEKMVVMSYEPGYTESNGHPNWMCLHD